MKKNATCLIIIACMLSGFAIYLGRIVRLNSWDIFRPFELISKVFANINMFAFKFSLLFGAYILFIYTVFMLCIIEINLRKLQMKN